LIYFQHSSCCNQTFLVLGSGKGDCLGAGVIAVVRENKSYVGPTGLPFFGTSLRSSVIVLICLGGQEERQVSLQLQKGRREKRLPSG
jgi:hypothetical protein